MKDPDAHLNLSRLSMQRHYAAHSVYRCSQNLENQSVLQCTDAQLAPSSFSICLQCRPGTLELSPVSSEAALFELALPYQDHKPEESRAEAQPRHRASRTFKEDGRMAKVFPSTAFLWKCKGKLFWQTS